MSFWSKARERREARRYAALARIKADWLARPMPVMRDYEARERGRSLDSFAYKFEVIWGHVVDTLYTDDRAEIDAMIPFSLNEEYDVRVTGPEGIEYYAADPAR